MSADAPPPAPTPTPSRITAALAQGRLGVAAVVFFALAGAAPLTVVGGVITGAYGVTGLKGIPVVYLATAAILAVFSVGFVAMSRHIVNAGAFYTYITRGLGRVPGIAAAHVAVLAYSFLQVGLYGAWGVVTAGFTHDRFGWDLTWWGCALIGWVAVTFLGLLRVRLNAAVLAVLLVAEVIITFAFDAVMISHPAGGTVTLATLDPKLLGAAGISAAFVVAITGFSGFEATVVLSEEARNPRTTIARATYIALGVTALIYALSAWAMSVAAGPDAIVGRAGSESTELVFNLTGPHMPVFVSDLGHMLFATSLFAALLVFHNAVARYLFSLGREQVLPPALGMVSPRTGAPIVASLAQSMTGLAVIVLYTMAGWDPFTRLFFWLGVTGGLGLLMLMITCSFAVAVFFLKAGASATENVWQRFIAPLAAAVALLVICYFTTQQYGDLLGVAPDHPAVWLFPASFFATGLIGAARAVYLQAARPEVYAAVGYGAAGVGMREEL